jgi:hypothetical protein
MSLFLFPTPSRLLAISTPEDIISPTFMGTPKACAPILIASFTPDVPMFFLATSATVVNPLLIPAPTFLKNSLNLAPFPTAPLSMSRVK